ncbi:MAG: hypothetical protein ACOYMI_11465 [Phycisphaerales bacterium]
MVAGAAALALLVSHSDAGTVLASHPSLAPLFREPVMTLTHFLLGCTVVAFALVAYSLVATVSCGIALMQSRAH